MRNLIIGIVLGVGAIIGTYYLADNWRNNSVNIAVLAERERLVMQYDKKVTEQIVLAMESQAKLQVSFDKSIKEKNAKITSANRKYNALVNSVQDRPSRPSSPTAVVNSCNTEGGSGVTGKGLYRDDASFLIGEAARAETIRLELISCYNLYDQVKDGLSK